jgi:hypothetical protein
LIGPNLIARKSSWTVVVPLLLVVMAGCQPTVKIDPPQEPITINLNIKLDAEVRVKLEEQAEKDVQTNPIF